MKRLLSAVCATFVAACSTPPAPPDEAAAAAHPLARDANADELHNSLAQLDEAVRAEPASAAAWSARGERNLQLARLTREQGGRGAQFLFLDAIADLRRAIALDGDQVGARATLARACLDADQLAEALAAADDVLQRAPTHAAAHAVRGAAAAQLYARRKAAGNDEPALLAAARASFAWLETHEALHADHLQQWAVAEQWAGNGRAATEVYARAIAPARKAELLEGLVTTAAAAGELPFAIEVLAARDDATSTWQLGRARYLLAQVQRAAGETTSALATLDAAQQSFAAAMAQNADYRDTCEQWLAMCLGSKGNLAFVTGDLANASTWLLDATRLRPDRIEVDLGSGETVKLGLLRVGNRTMRDFARTELFFRTAAALVPGDVDLLNNAAVYARDLGVRLLRAGRTADAAAMWERSYVTYRRAATLAPRDVRIANDCALIAIHHLERNWDESRRLLDDGIRTGEAMLRDQPPADARALQDLQEAVGDCHENLALWHLKHGKDGLAAKAAATASLGWFPGDKRAGAKQHLAAAEQMLQTP